MSALSNVYSPTAEARQESMLKRPCFNMFQRNAAQALRFLEVARPARACIRWAETRSGGGGVGALEGPWCPRWPGSSGYTQTYIMTLWRLPWTSQNVWLASHSKQYHCHTGLRASSGTRDSHSGQDLYGILPTLCRPRGQTPKHAGSTAKSASGNRTSELAWKF